MKTTTNKPTLFFTWTYKCLKYFCFGSIGFALACIISASFSIPPTSIPIFWFVINLLWRLGMTILLLLGVAIVFESWR